MKNKYIIDIKLHIFKSYSIYYLDEQCIQTVLWNRNYFLRFWFRFRLLKIDGAGSGSTTLRAIPKSFSTKQKVPHLNELMMAATNLCLNFEERWEAAIS